MTDSGNRPPVALAIFAHPDDVEFTCAGTLELLRRAGYETHYLNLADGCCGSMTEGRDATARRRWGETRAAAETLGAIPHPPLFHDLEIFFNDLACRKTAAVLREIGPEIILTHATRDYMEDHMNTARLALHAAFTAGMPNYRTEPEIEPNARPCALYHVLPHGLREPADGRRAYPAFYVGVEDVMPVRREALACHESQKKWLDETQGMDAYLDTMDGFARTLGEDTGAFGRAEGFTRHLHIGLGGEDTRPLENALGDRILENTNYPHAPENP